MIDCFRTIVVWMWTVEAAAVLVFAKILRLLGLKKADNAVSDWLIARMLEQKRWAIAVWGVNPRVFGEEE